MSKQRIFTPEERKYRALKERERRARLKAEDPEYYKKNYQKKKEYYQKFARDKYQRNKDKILERGRAYRLRPEVKARKKEYNRQYREKNWDWIKKDQQEYVRRREKESPEFKLKRRLRERTRDALDYHKFIKIDSFTKAIGCTPEELRKYIEKQFEPGMTWENYGSGHGKWNLDHIIPLSLAESVDHLYKLCHYTNVRPMWSIENSSRGNKYEPK